MFLAADGGLSGFELVRGLGPRFALAVIGDLALGRSRSIADDARRIVGLLRPAPDIVGQAHVPARQPFVLVANHWHRGSMWVGWVAMAITAAVAEAREPGHRGLHWLTLSEWRWLEVAGHWIANPISALLFPRVGALYGSILTPSRPADVSGRARAVRQVLSCLEGGAREGHPAPVGIFPEGTGTTALREARPGTGALLRWIARRGAPLLPVGAYQEGPRLTLRFGEPFSIAPAPGVPAVESDRLAREQVMVAIGRLLPERLWGFYRQTLRDGGAGGGLGGGADDR